MIESNNTNETAWGEKECEGKKTISFSFASDWFRSLSGILIAMTVTTSADHL